MKMMVTKKTIDFSALDFVAGETLLIDKPKEWTSFRTVRTIKKAVQIKVGHTGTLDPLATGLLILLTGKNTKLTKHFETMDKTYTGSLLLGKSSPSMDTMTEMVEHQLPENLSEKELYKLRDTFLGEIEQVPPMFSAIKHKGKKLYEYARKGIEVERKSRKIRISKFDLKKIDLPEIHFEIQCSKGTYIRAIANDFGNNLGCGAVMNSLRRTKIGDYDVADALTVQQFLQKLEKPG